MDSKQKICFIIPEYNKKTPTHFNYLYGFIKRLSQDLDIFLVVERGSAPEVGLGYKRVAALMFGFAPFKIGEFLIRLLYARVKGYKDFYVHYTFLGAMTASIIVKLFGGRVFYWNCGEPWKYRRNFLRENFEIKVYKMINYLVTGTESLALEYSTYYEMPVGKIKVMPNYIDLEKIKNPARHRKYELGSGVAGGQISKIKKNDFKLKLGIKENVKVILFVHRLSERKGAQYLPEILEKLKDEPIVLVVVGDGPLRKDIEKRIMEKGLGERVRFLGWVPQEAITDYFGVADVFLMPSDEEGFPHVLLESMAQGVPFVVTDVGGVRDIVPPQMLDYVVSNRTTENFAIKIKELLNLNEMDRGLLGQILEKHVERYDIDVVAERFKEIIRM